jgi:hypothetical protein
MLSDHALPDVAPRSAKFPYATAYGNNRINLLSEEEAGG